jgi:hypothetical protein
MRVSLLRQLFGSRHRLTLGGAVAALAGSAALAVVVSRMGGRNVLAALGALAVALAALERPRLLLVGILLTAFSADYLQFVFGLPALIKWTPDLLSVSLFALALISVRDLRQRWMPLRPIVIALACLLAVFGISAILNQTSPNVLLAGFKNYFVVFFLFFAVILLDLTEKQQRLLVLLMVGLMLLQVPVAALQRFGALPGAATQASGVEDFAGGTLGINATGFLSVLCVGLAVSMLNQAVFEKFRWRYLAVIGVILVAPVLAEGKIVILLLPVMAVMLLALRVRVGAAEGWPWLIGLPLLGLVAVAASAYLIPILAPRTTLTEVFGSFEALFAYMYQPSGDFQFAQFGRLADLDITLQLVSESALSFLFGFGPGLLSSAGRSAMGGASALTWYVEKGIGGIQATAFMLEVGALGAAIYTILLVLLFRQMWPALRAPGRDRAVPWATLAILSLVLYVLAAFYTQLWWSSAASTAFWCLMAICWIRVRSS